MNKFKYTFEVGPKIVYFLESINCLSRLFFAFEFNQLLDNKYRIFRHFKVPEI